MSNIFNRALAVGRISKIKIMANETQQDINKTQRELVNYINGLKQCRGKIYAEISDEKINGRLLGEVDGIIDKMFVALKQSKAILDGLSADATNKIKSIVDEYNNSINPEHPEEPLKYEQVVLTSIAGIIGS